MVCAVIFLRNAYICWKIWVAVCVVFYTASNYPSLIHLTKGTPPMHITSIQFTICGSISAIANDVIMMLSSWLISPFIFLKVCQIFSLYHSIGLCVPCWDRSLCRKAVIQYCITVCMKTLYTILRITSPYPVFYAGN